MKEWELLWNPCWTVPRFLEAISSCSSSERFSGWQLILMGRFCNVALSHCEMGGHTIWVLAGIRCNQRDYLAQGENRKPYACLVSCFLFRCSSRCTYAFSVILSFAVFFECPWDKEEHRPSPSPYLVQESLSDGSVHSFSLLFAGTWLLNSGFVVCWWWLISLQGKKQLPDMVPNTGRQQGFF